MDELLKKIKNLIRFKYHYFLIYPNAPYNEFNRKIKELSIQLLQEIPISVGHGATYQYLSGKILNIGEDFDANAEEHLERSIRADATNVDAWLELGMCAWKRGNTQKSFECFQMAVDRSPNSPKCLCLLAAAFRKRATQSQPAAPNTKGSSEPNNSDHGAALRARLLNVKEALRLCQDALKIREDYPFGWYSLGNTYLLRFFTSGQLSPNDLKLAFEAFEKSVEISNRRTVSENYSKNEDPSETVPTLPWESPRVSSEFFGSRAFVSADLHLNCGVAHLYAQNYARALENFRRALEIEPHLAVAREHFDALQQFLATMNDRIQRKGTLSKRQLRDLVDALNDSKVVAPFAETGLKAKFVSDLREGANSDVFVALKVVGMVHNDNDVPYTLVGVDGRGDTIGVTFFNIAKNFGAMVRDSFLIPQPHLICVENVTVSQLAKDGTHTKVTLNFCALRVIDVARVVKNGRAMGRAFCAPVNASIQTARTEA